MDSMKAPQKGYFVVYKVRKKGDEAAKKERYNDQRP